MPDRGASKGAEAPPQDVFRADAGAAALYDAGTVEVV